jgi:hypothetical protein
MKSIKIALQQPQASYSPEIYAYQAYARRRGHKVFLVKDFKNELADSAEVHWHICGFPSAIAKNKLHIFEYQSLSTPPLARIKDFLKINFCPTPSLRVFLNQTVSEKFLKLNILSGQTRFLLRDMGVDSRFLKAGIASKQAGTRKKYTFVYIGSTDRKRRFESLLQQLCTLREPTLIIGKKPKHISALPDWIDFTGPIPYEEVPNLATEAEYGLNFVPDTPPYSFQTSTKLIEYCALGLKVITSEHGPSLRFEYEREAAFFHLGSKLDFSGYRDFAYKTPSVDDLEWSRVIEASKIFDFIESREVGS